MAKPVFIPKFGFTLEESEIVEWLVDEGATVQAGDPVAEVTTDKVNMEVEAPADGILAGICAQVGDTVPVTATIAWILAAGESLPEEAAEMPAAISHSSASPEAGATEPDTPALTTPAHSVPSPTPVASRIAQAHDLDLSQVAGSGRGGRIERRDVEAALSASDDSGKVRATPAARRLAGENGLELSTINGTGPNGRIQAADVTSAMEQPSITDEQLLDTDRQPLATEGVTRVPFTNMRRTIARRLQQSAQEAPHIFFEASASVAELQALCDVANEQRADDEPKVSLTAGITKAVAWALGRHPIVNSHIGADEVLLFEDIHVGMAVALENGLVVPVIRHADRKGLRELSADIRSLAEKARSGKLTPTEMSGGTFSISNLGMFGVERFTAIINPPEVGILAVGAVQKTLVVDEHDQPVVRPMMNLTLSVDHRVIDGAVAAQFLADLKRVIEQPNLMLM